MSFSSLTTASMICSMGVIPDPPARTPCFILDLLRRVQSVMYSRQYSLCSHSFADQQHNNAAPEQSRQLKAGKPVHTTRRKTLQAEVLTTTVTRVIVAGAQRAVTANIST
jgi:hypothetical protein